MTERLSEAQRDLLKRIAHETFCGAGMTARASPERHALKRRGLIKSGPTNPPGFTAISGKTRRWRITDAGRKALED